MHRRISVREPLCNTLGQQFSPSTITTSPHSQLDSARCQFSQCRNGFAYQNIMTGIFMGLAGAGGAIPKSGRGQMATREKTWMHPGPQLPRKDAKPDINYGSLFSTAGLPGPFFLLLFFLPSKPVSATRRGQLHSYLCMLHQSKQACYQRHVRPDIVAGMSGQWL